jgi:putative Mn2+ efflux pump MntP
MSWIEIILLALALAVDAFTVGAAVGLTHQRKEQIFRLSWHFGVFQALMPLVGALAGKSLERFVAPFSHWLAFGLLALIGGRMIHGALRQGERRFDRDLTRGLSLIGLSVAVSIDALAAGFTLGLRQESIALPVIVIGAVAAALTAVGMVVAGRLGQRIGKGCELVAGVVLIGLGVKIVVEHFW